MAEVALLPSDAARSEQAPMAEVALLPSDAASSQATIGVAGPGDKEQVLNDITNTGVMAALIGGFALSNMQANDFLHEESMLDTATYLLLTFAVHACTCSALTSAVLYREVNMMAQPAVRAWADTNWMLLLMPMGKFGMGCVAYIVSVLFASYRALEQVPVSQGLALFIGLASLSTVVLTIGKLQWDKMPKAVA
jgi:hypothetical protein